MSGKATAKRYWIIGLVLTVFSAFAEPNKIVVYLIGDSTMSVKETKAYPETGWGMPFAHFFDSSVVIDNRAQNGRSTRTFLEENRWQPVVDKLKEGDYVFIQFGHNDEIKSKKSYTPENEYRSYLIKYVTEAQQKKATPILLTPVARRYFDDQGNFTGTHDTYSAIVRSVAKEFHVPCIDLDSESKKLYVQLGKENSKWLFNHLSPNENPNYPLGKQDNTHFNEIGARKIAEIVLQEIKKLQLPLAEKAVDPVPSGDWKLPTVIAPSFKSDTFNIVQYGAIADGLTLNTKAVNTAISECNAKGGGVVKVPNGLWLTGPIGFKSNVNLFLEDNATLLFTTDKSQYELIESNWEGLPAVRNQSPIYGNNLENIAITGKGIIDGNGDSWRAVKKDKLSESQWHKLVATGGLVSEDGKTWYPSEQYYQGSKLDKPGVLLNGKTLQDYKAFKDFFRPNILVFTNCKKILLDGPTFQNSAAWGLHPLMCEQVTVRNVYVKNPWYAQNGDGIDVESCSNVLIEGCTFDVGDDGICIKSGRDEEGRKRAKPTENLIARNCVVYHAHGGFVIGSEMSGGVKNLYVENCTFIGTDIGLRFKTARGRGGMVENIYVRNINMRDIVGEAILFDMYYMAKDPILLAGEKREAPKVQTFPVTEATPQFRNFTIDNVICNGAAKAIFIRGLPEMPIHDILLQNIVIRAKKGIEIIEGQNIGLKNGKVEVESHGPVVDIQNSNKLWFENLQFQVKSPLLFHIKGSKSNEILVTKTDVSKAVVATEFADGAVKGAVEIK